MARKILKKSSSGQYSTQLENVSSELLQRQELWTDFDVLQADVLAKFKEFTQNCLCDDDNNCDCICESNRLDVDLESSINCVFFNRWHDFIMPLIHQQYENEDADFFNKSTELCKINITAEQMGAPEDYAIPLSAAIVELSSLDNHKSPLEKLQCLTTAYDLIFVQLKYAQIDVIASRPGSDNQIPVVENSDVVPVLMTVIVRSKLIHFISNLYYIKTFYVDFIQYCNSCNTKTIFDKFQEAAEKLKSVNKETLRPGSGKICRDLDLVGFIKMSLDNDSKTADELTSPLDRQVSNMTDLIIAATNENHA